MEEGKAYASIPRRLSSLQTKQVPLYLLHVASTQFQHHGSDPVVTEESDTYSGHAARQVIACKAGLLRRIVRRIQPVNNQESRAADRQAIYRMTIFEDFFR